MGIYLKIREKMRFSPLVQKLIYSAESLRYSRNSPLTAHIERRKHFFSGEPKGVALSARIKDEAHVLAEWLDYHIVAGVSHFFIYESFSSDNFREVLRPYIEGGHVTLLADWPTVPVTPYAEEDCILRALNRFEWVANFDVDEFLVIKDGSSIGEFLSRFPGQPAVALHWFMFGSSGHKHKPSGPVIRAFTKRADGPNRHVKAFVRPDQVTHCRNPHSWHYRGLRHAISEAGKPIYGSFSPEPLVRDAWIAHFHTKSEEDYLAKMRKKEACDPMALRFPVDRHTEDRLRKHLIESNKVEDLTVQEYYRRRCEALSVPPTLLLDGDARERLLEAAPA